MIKKKNILVKNLNIENELNSPQNQSDEKKIEKPKRKRNEIKNQNELKKQPKRRKPTILSLITSPYNSNQSLLFPNENFFYLPDERESILSKLSMIENILLNYIEDEDKFKKEIPKLKFTQEKTKFNFFYEIEKSKCKNEEIKNNLEENFLSINRPYLRLSLANDIMENKISLNEFGLRNGDLIHVPFSEREKIIVENEMIKENFQFEKIKQ